MRWKRLFYYLLINVLVSACTTLAVLTIWQQLHPDFFGDLNLLSSAPSPTPESRPVPVRLETPTLMPTVEIEPTQALTMYQVRAGDTLGEIAEQFDTNVDVLMELNGLENPSSLGSGQVLFVPLKPEQSTEEIQPTEGLATSSAPTETSGSGSDVVITNVFGAGDLETERVRLECEGSAEVSLSGWKLVESNGESFAFPQLTLYPGGDVDVYTRGGVNSVVALYWGQSEAQWETGEVVMLLDSQGTPQATYVVP